MGVETLDFGRLDQVYPNSYLRFSHHPEIWEVDAEAIKGSLLKPGQRVALLGAGYGADIEHLESQGVLKDTTVFAVDLDLKALNYMENAFGNNSEYDLQLREEDMVTTSIENESIDETYIINSGHIRGWRPTLGEGSRITRRGGIIKASSAYMSGHAYPTKKDRLVWGKILREGGENVLAIPEYSHLVIPPAEDLVTPSNDLLLTALDKELRLEVLEVRANMVHMDRECVKAICYYEGFAEGAIQIPEVPLSVRADGLVRTVDSVFDELGIDHVDREWMIFKFKKY